MNYYLTSDNYGRNKINVELDLSNYTTKSEVKKARDNDASDFAEKTDLASLKLDADEIIS